MASRIRFLAACLLMLLLPLQGIASAAGLRAMANCPMGAMQGPDCCEHGTQAAASPDQAHQHAGHQPAQQTDGSCGMQAGCPLLSPPAVLAATGPLPSPSAVPSQFTGGETSFTSHSPDAPRHPPRQDT
jgi:hypothetical protein